MCFNMLCIMKVNKYSKYIHSTDLVRRTHGASVAPDITRLNKMVDKNLLVPLYDHPFICPYNNR